MSIEWLLDRSKNHTTSYGGLKLLLELPTPMAKGEIPTWPQLLRKETKGFLDGGVHTMPKVLEAYKLYGWGVVAWTNPIWSILNNYALGCCSVASATRWSTQEWTFVDGSPHLTIGYLLMENSKCMCRRGCVPSHEFLGSAIWWANHARVWMCRFALATLARVAKRSRWVKGHQQGLRYHFYSCKPIRRCLFIMHTMQLHHVSLIHH